MPLVQEAVPLGFESSAQIPNPPPKGTAGLVGCGIAGGLHPSSVGRKERTEGMFGAQTKGRQILLRKKAARFVLAFEEAAATVLSGDTSRDRSDGAAMVDLRRRQRREREMAVSKETNGHC